MALGANDALGIPRSKLSIYPSRVRVGAPVAAPGSGFVTFGSTILDEGNGQVECVTNAALGDRFAIRSSGLYSITGSLLMNQDAGQVAVVKNIPIAYAAVSPLDLADYATYPQLAPNVLSIWVATEAAHRSGLGLTTWLDAGDFIQLMTNQTFPPADTSQFFQVEKLYG